MRLVMAGLDYKTADMEIREKFSPVAETLPALLRRVPTDDVAGCVLIATCNRVELYMSHRCDVPPDGADLLCGLFGCDARRHRKYVVERNERQAVEHLMRVAAGMESGVPGDDQIITQVRRAIEIAREAETADPVLEALFRSAVAAGKRVKSRVSFAREGASVAGRAVKVVAERLGNLHDRRVLVVGNGLIGRLAAGELSVRGCRVAMTLRDERRRPEMPPGCECVDFGRRYEAMTGCDAVLSATSSPGHVVTLTGVRDLADIPGLFVDLAVPRDVEPALSRLEGISLLNVDDLRVADDGGEFARSLAAAEEIIADEAGRFDLWRRNRLRRSAGVADEPDFPVFISLRGATVLVAGGGRVAARRAEKLLAFGARVHVVSPALSPALEGLLVRDGLRWTAGVYHSRHMDGATLAIAATDDREANRRIGQDARERGILVSVADRRRECTFYFPAIVKSDFLTAGLVSNNGDHALVRRAARELRQEMEAIDADYQGREPRKQTGGGAGDPDHGCVAPPASGHPDRVAHDEDRRRPHSRPFTGENRGQGPVRQGT